MKQVLILHGGNSFSTDAAYLESLKSKVLDYDRLLYSDNWRGWIANNLADYDVLSPAMPNSANAKFHEWQIYFEKLLPFLTDDVQIVGHSLGAMFLVKYLQANPLQRKIKRLVLLAPAYDDNSREDLGSFGINSANKLPESAHEIHIFHSQDDPVVPFSELAKYSADIPDAVIHRFTNASHFLEPTFPELLALLKK